MSLCSCATFKYIPAVSFPRRIEVGMFINHVGLLDSFSIIQTNLILQGINKHYKKLTNTLVCGLTKLLKILIMFQIESNRVLGSHLFNVRRKYSNVFIEWLNQQCHSLLRVLQKWKNTTSVSVIKGA